MAINTTKSNSIYIQPVAAETIDKIAEQRLKKTGLKDSRSRIVTEAVFALAKKEGVEK